MISQKKDIAKTILIADDSPTMRVMLKDILNSEGYTVISSEDGIQAAEKAFTHQPDLIICDIEMPKMDGYQVCRLLKNDPQTSDIPIIILTSKNESGAVFWGYQTGADLYLLKNFKPEELTGSIQDVFHKSKRKNERKLSAHKTVDAVQIMAKLNTFLDSQLFETTLINEINKTTLNLAPLSDTLNTLLEIMEKGIDNELISFAVISDEREILLNVKINTDTSDKNLELFEFQTLEDLANLLNKDISEHKINVELVNQDRVTETAEDNDQPDHSSMYSIPLRVKEEVVGILNIFNKNMEQVPAQKKKLMDRLGKYVSTAITTTILHNKIKNLSVIDSLTQLYNRRYIMDNYKQEFNKSRRYTTDMSVVMIDIDDFKKINDTYGHLTGDLVLKNLSQIIKSSLRNFDLPGRYGGEEFIVILTQTDIESAVIVAERIREKVEQTPFTTMSNEKINVSISIGLSNIGEITSETNELELIKLADSRLYKAKNQGKNCVVSK